MDDNKTTVVEGSVVEEPETPVTEEPIAASEHPEGAPCAFDPEPEFAKNDEDKDDDEKDEPKEEEPKKEDDEEDEDKKKYELLSEEHATLQESYSNLQGEYSALVEAHKTLKESYEKLVEFKKEIDDANKDRMIESFSMLSDEEKKDVIANKANYTVEDIEEKLSVICFRKGNFDLNNSSKNNNNTEEPITTFNYGATAGSSKPDWLKAVDNVKNN